VDDAAAVGLVEKVGDLDGVTQRLAERERPLLQPVEEGLPLQVLHDDVLDVAFLPHVVEGADVGAGRGSRA
jgi:hypothetical protein